MQSVSTDRAPRPRGHYSQGVIHNGFVFTAGQLPFDPGTGTVTGDSIEEQTRQALRNVEAVIQAAGATRADVVKVTVFVPDMGVWGAVNQVYAEFFGDHKPARSVVPTRELHGGVLIEIEAVAAIQ